MFRRWLHIVTLTVFLASTSGLSLAVHERLEGTHHNSQKCSICQDLATGSKAVVPAAPSVSFLTNSAEILAIAAAQQPVVADLHSDIFPRAPPLA